MRNIWDDLEFGVFGDGSVVTHEVIYKALDRGRALEQVASVARSYVNFLEKDAQDVREALAALDEKEE